MVINFSNAMRVCLGVVFFCTLTVNAWGGLFEDDEARKAILDLRRQVESLQEKLAIEAQRSTTDGVQLRRSLFELQNQIEVLRAELATLRGLQEQATKDLAELQRQQKDVLQITHDRLRKLEPVPVAIDGVEFSADPQEKRDFEAALALVRKGEFTKARLELMGFLHRYPQTGYRPSVFFWLGNVSYANKNYQDALANFRALLTRFPDHMRVPDAMLAIADCHIEQKDNKAARKTLNELLTEYPKSQAAATAKNRLARLR